MNRVSLRRFFRADTQIVLTFTYTMVSAVVIVLLTTVLYQGFSTRMDENAVSSSTKVLDLAAKNLEDYLQNMRHTADAMYYNVIKARDIEVDSLNDEMGLLYEANASSLVSFALYRYDGSLVAASPVAVEKKNLDVRSQNWFQAALNQVENLHFSNPHVQNLFDLPSYQYNWVISLSQAVNMTQNGRSVPGVMLVDMSYTSVKTMMDDINTGNTDGGYIYLTDGSGNIIYHPRRLLIDSGLFFENRDSYAYKDGVHEEVFENRRRVVIVNTISYTGWKLISVIPAQSFGARIRSNGAFALMVVAAMLLAAFVINRMVAMRISMPLERLNYAIQHTDEGFRLTEEVYEDGSQEVVSLGKTMQSYIEQIDRLMKDVVVEQEEKRKSELDALQAQINPHFLYNTLDSIVWMIEGGRSREAIFMITQLARLFRISLSKGMTMIRLDDEIRHAESYMNIQKVRYKNAFVCTFDISPEIRDAVTVKLILQPILENAIYHGIKDMQEEGRIEVKGYRKGDDIYIDVIDNGYGMPESEIKAMFAGDVHSSGHGSGVGMINVHRRIGLRFGEEYGLLVESELDEGTKVTIHIPYIPYTEENRQRLEGENG